jgi:hypothetical protein
MISIIELFHRIFRDQHQLFVVGGGGGGKQKRLHRIVHNKSGPISAVVYIPPEEQYK